MLIVLISSLILSVYWLLSFYIFSQKTFAFKPTNQTGQQQKEMIPLSSSSNAYSLSNSKNVNTIEHSLALQGMQKITDNRTIEIVFDSTLLGEKAYDPNPLIASPNTTISWHNKDHILHTATSGLGMEDNNKGKEFDSSIIIADGTYFHTFSKLGIYPYFCILHPTMIGKVVIIPNEIQHSTSHLFKNLTNNKE
jgi:plastocyanin